jgi:hypothetical protein
MSCPYTSPQNGKVERNIRSINNVVCSLLFQTSMPPHIGLRHSPQQQDYLTSCQPRPLPSLGRTLPCMALLRRMIIYGCSAANATRTCLPQLPTNSHPGLPYVYSLAIPTITKDIVALTSLPMASSSRGMPIVIFDGTAFPFADHDGPRSPVAFEFLDDLHTVPDPIGPQHMFLPTTTPGDPKSSAAPTDPMLSLPSPAPCAASSLLPAPSAAPTTPSTAPSTTSTTCPDPDYISPAPRTVQPCVATRSPPSGFLPQASVITNVYMRQERTDPIPESAAPFPVSLPKGVVVHPMTNQHPMATRAKQGFRVLALFHAAQLSRCPRPTVVASLTQVGALPWRKSMLPFCRITLGISCLDHLRPTW